jgi:hypothetical protein
MTPHELLVADIARTASDRAVRSAIRALQHRTEDLHSGDQSGLKDAWDEICVQVQVEHSVFWGVYEKTAEPIVAHEVARLSPQEATAIWLQTRPGQEWLAEAGDEAALGYCLEDVVAHLLAELMAAAGRYSNERIRGYVNR